MTELIYQTDAYLKTIRSRVTGVNEEHNAVLLDKTIFYPGGGGQPADTGSLTDMATGQVYVVKTVKRGNLHVIEGQLPQLSAEVLGEIDWGTRYKLMRTHTALHVLCGVIWHTFGASVTGGNMEPLKGRMDFEFERMQKELVQEIDQLINEAAAKAYPVNTEILPRAQAFQIPDLIRTKIILLPEGIEHVRTVEIVGLDLQACGGTHLNNTSEIGRISVVDYKSKGGINKRLYIELDA